MHPYKMMLAQELSSLRSHLISLRGDNGWPARSPDLTPCGFFLWRYLKAKFYARRPGTIEQLKEAIRQEIAAIPPAMTRKVMDNFRELLQNCVINNGRHLSDVIFKLFAKNCTIRAFYKKKEFFVYLASFDFYCPSKCGIYFYRSLLSTAKYPVLCRWTPL